MDNLISKGGPKQEQIGRKIRTFQIIIFSIDKWPDLISSQLSFLINFNQRKMSHKLDRLTKHQETKILLKIFPSHNESSVWIITPCMLNVIKVLASFFSLICPPTTCELGVVVKLCNFSFFFINASLIIKIIEI